MEFSNFKIEAIISLKSIDIIVSNPTRAANLKISQDNSGRVYAQKELTIYRILALIDTSKGNKYYAYTVRQLDNRPLPTPLLQTGHCHGAKFYLCVYVWRPFTSQL